MPASPRWRSACASRAAAWPNWRMSTTSPPPTSRMIWHERRRDPNHRRGRQADRRPPPSHCGEGGRSWLLPRPPAPTRGVGRPFPAGSSSGTGAGIAAGLILGGIGTDTGGSIRGPAALCGIAGIKPTYGLVSRAGVAPAAFSLDHIGPMAWTAADCRLMLQALAGHDPRDPASADRPVPDYTALIGAGVKGLKIGVLP